MWRCSLFETRLHLFESTTPVAGLCVLGPETVFSPEDRARLGERLERTDIMYVIRPLENERLTVRGLGPSLESLDVATVGPYTLRIIVQPSRHDTIEVLVVQTRDDT